MKHLAATNLEWHPPDSARAVMRVANFSLDAGEVVAVSGPSGAGKSTFLRCLAALTIPTSGELRLDGEAVTPANVLEHRRRVGYVAQKASAIARSIDENLAFAREISGREDAWEHQEDRLVELGFEPDDAWLRRDFASLSGGEQQRVALVRSLTTEPEVLLLDEPTTGLDRPSALRMESLLGKYLTKEGRAAIWVSHDATQLDRLNARIFSMEAP